MISKILGSIGAKIGEIISNKLETPADKAIKAESVVQAKIKTKSDQLELEQKKLSFVIKISKETLDLAKEIHKNPESAEIMKSLLENANITTQNATYNKNGKLK